MGWRHPRPPCCLPFSGRKVGVRHQTLATGTVETVWAEGRARLPAKTSKTSTDPERRVGLAWLHVLLSLS